MKDQEIIIEECLEFQKEKLLELRVTDKQVVQIWAYISKEKQKENEE